MKIPNELEKYFQSIKEGDKIELSDAQTKIIIKPEHECYKIIVDKGIIQNVCQGIKKSDFAILDEIDNNLVLVELKGTVIDKAILQLMETLKNIESNELLQILVLERNRIVGCIVSPNRQQIPKGSNSHARELAKKLYSKSKNKPQDMMDLIWYIKVVPKQKEFVINKNNHQIICSNRMPLSLNQLTS